MTTVSILFKGEDDVTGDVKKIEGEIGKLEKQTKSADKSSKSLFTTLGGFGKLAGGFALGGAIAGITGLGAALVSGIGDAREAAQVMAATENVIESMGRTGAISADEISQMAGELSAAAGMSLFGDDDIQAGENMLLTFANINEVLPDATQAMVDMTQFMGGDMTSAATMLGKALDNPKEGLSALTRVGVSFSEQQKEMITTMQDAGNMAGAQGVILEALQSQFGGAALAAAQADGGWAQFRDRMGEIGESVGARALPMLNSLTAWLNSPEVQTGIQSVADSLVAAGGAVISFGQYIASVVTTGDSLNDFLANLPAPLQTVGKAIADWVIIPAQDVIAAFNEWKAFGTEWGIVAALQAIGENFPLVKPLTDWLQNVAPGAVQTVREAFGLAHDSFITFRDALAGEWHADPEKIHPLHEAIGEFGLQIRNEVIPALSDLYGSLKEQAPAAWATFKTSIQEDVLPVLKLITDQLNKQSNEDLPHTESQWVWFGNRLAQILNSSMALAVGWGDDIRSIFTSTVSAIAFQFEEWDRAVERWSAALSAAWNSAWASMSSAVTTAKDIIAGAMRVMQGIIEGVIDKINALISLINHIPTVHIPSIPSIGGSGGSSGFGGSVGKSLGGFTPLSSSVSTSNVSHVTHIDARGASDPRGVEAAVGRAMAKAGVRTDLRLRTT